jgi:uncharacterized membrane protein
MVRSAVVVAIDRPIAQVFAFVANAETAPQWRQEIVDVRRSEAAASRPMPQLARLCLRRCLERG